MVVMNEKELLDEANEIAKLLKSTGHIAEFQDEVDRLCEIVQDLAYTSEEG